MAKIVIVDNGTTTIYEDICNITPKFRSKEIAILQREDIFEVLYLCGNSAVESLERYIADSDGPCDLHDYYILHEEYSNLQQAQKQNQSVIKKLEKELEEKDKNIHALKSSLLRLINMCDSHEHSNTFTQNFQEARRSMMDQINDDE